MKFNRDVMMQTYRYKLSQKWKQRVSSKLQIKYRVGCPQIYKWKICQKCKGGTWFMKQIQIKLKFQSNTSIKGIHVYRTKWWAL